MVVSCIIKVVTPTRDYGIQVESNISEAQHLSGIEMADKFIFVVAHI